MKKTIQNILFIFYSSLISATSIAGIQMEINSSPVSGSLSYEQSMSAAILDAKLPVHYVWDFGDGSTSFETNPVHAYMSPGEYRIWLNIIDAEGNTGQDIHWVQIRHDVFQKDQIVIKRYLNTLNINCFYVDHDQNNAVWIGTNGGLIYVDLNNNHQQYYRSQLPSEKVNDICQLFDYSFWFATTNGLVRYDPEFNQWATYHSENTVITENHIQALAPSIDQKKLWVGTMGGGIVCWDALQKKWLQYSAKNTDLISNHIQDLAVDYDDNLWVATHRGICVLNTTTQQWQLFNKDNSGLLENVINVIACSAQGIIWVGTWNQGIASFNPSNNEWSAYHSGNSPLKKNFIEKLITSPDGNIWIAAQEKGLFKFNSQTDSWHHYTHDNSALPDVSINDVVSVNDHAVVVNAGKYLIQMDNQSTQQQFMLIKQRQISDNTIACAMQSKNEMLWIGFRNKGLTCFNPKNHHWSVWDPMNSPIPAYDIRCIVETTDSYIAVGTSNGLVLYDENHQQWSVYQTTNSNISNNNITALYYDKNAYLWIGTIQGIVRFHPSTLQWENFYSESIDLDDHITCLAQSVDGKIWAGTSQNGLLQYSNDTHSWQRLNQANSGLLDNRIQKMISTSSDHLWIATLYSGLLTYHLNDNTWTSYNTSNSCLLKNSLTSLHADNDGVLWIGDNDGHLYRFHTLTKEWHTVSINDNTSDISPITCIEGSDENSLWLGTQGSGLLNMSWPQSLDSPGNVLIIQGIDEHHSTPDQLLYLQNIYRIFSNHGFRHHDIMTIAQTDDLDMNGDGISDDIVDELPDISNIETAINQWAVDEYSPNKPLFIFILGQWSMNEFNQPVLHLPDNKQFSALNLQQLIALYEQETGGKTIVVINGINASNSLLYLSSRARTVITSGPSEINTKNNSIYGTFLHYFLNELETHVSVYKAFINARQQESMWLNKNFSTPLMDDNGDGLSDMLDGVFANQVLLSEINEDIEIPVLQHVKQKLENSNSLEVTAIYSSEMAQAGLRLDQISLENERNNSITIHMDNCHEMTFCGKISGITPTGTYELKVMALDYEGRLIVSEPSVYIIGRQHTGSLQGQVQLFHGGYAFSYNDVQLSINLYPSEFKINLRSDGSFFADNIPEGIYQLDFFGPNFNVLLPHSVEIKDGETSQLTPIAFEIEDLWCSSDADCNGIIDLKDVIFLLQHLTYPKM